ncbi:MAG: FG-GAP repeat domain-containing protein, partial [Terriglobia bacterium]
MTSLEESRRSRTRTRSGWIFAIIMLVSVMGGADLMKASGSCPSPSFGTAVNLSAGTHPFAVAVGDFNSDGKVDMAVTNVGDISGNGGSVLIYLGHGDGTFPSTINHTAVNYPSLQRPSGIAVGDFNRDGKLDLAVTEQVSGRVSILIGNGDGSFQTPVDYATGDAPVSVAVGDFNGDGKADLAVANMNYVSVLLGNGDGSFSAAVNYTAGLRPM